MIDPLLSVQRDIESIQSIPGIDSILKLLIRATSLRVALVARVTEDSWSCCSVVDRAGFGLEVGDSLEVATTY